MEKVSFSWGGEGFEETIAMFSSFLAHYNLSYIKHEINKKGSNDYLIFLGALPAGKMEVYRPQVRPSTALCSIKLTQIMVWFSFFEFSPKFITKIDFPLLEAIESDPKVGYFGLNSVCARNFA